MNRIEACLPEAQPEFPERDLTEQNVETLAIILGNRAVVMNAHELAESAHVVMRVAHPAVVTQASVSTDGARIAAVSYGNNLFEGIASMVNTVPDTTSSVEDMMKAHIAVKQLFHKNGNVFVNLSDSVDEFKETMTNTSELITETTSRYFSGLSEYAIFGAALERKIILDAQLLGDSNTETI